jgi:hypothetical protein
MRITKRDFPKIQLVSATEFRRERRYQCIGGPAFETSCGSTLCLAKKSESSNINNDKTRIISRGIAEFTVPNPRFSAGLTCSEPNPVHAEGQALRVARSIAAQASDVRGGGLPAEPMDGACRCSRQMARSQWTITLAKEK